MISSVFITLSLSFLSILSGTSASPLIASRGASCQPNFEGTGVSVVNNGVEWGFVDTNPGIGSSIVNQDVTTEQAEFRFAFNGAPTNSYTIRSLQVPQFPEQVISTGDDSGFLTLQPENLSSPADPLQSFIIQCDACNTGASGFSGLYASGCTISPAGSQDLCVQTDGVVDDTPFLTTCTVGEAAQKFDFWIQG